MRTLYQAIILINKSLGNNLLADFNRYKFHGMTQYSHHVMGGKPMNQSPRMIS